MKVLVLQSELGVLRGGGENFTRNLFTAFVARGHQVAAAFVADPRGRYPLPLPEGIEPIPLSGWWSMNLGQTVLSLWGRYLPRHGRIRAEWDRVQEAISWRAIRWHYRRFQQCIERRFAERWDNYDAVYVHSNVSLAGTVAKYCPTVLRLPGPVTAEHAPVLRAVHAVCANGDALVRIRTFLGNTVLELPIGLNVQHFSPSGTSVRRALGWTTEHKVFGYVGRLIHLKGVTLLASAFRDLRREAADARLLIVGSGEDEKTLRAMLAEELYRGLVHFEPAVDHDYLPAWYRAMDVLVMPSRYENFSNVMLEAMACGLPIVASDVGGNRTVAESEAGWLFQPESVLSLSETLRTVIVEQTALKGRGYAGLRYVQERYSWARSAECLEQIMIQRLGVPA
jgi:glycosyltransferase involved in cell wall biosynthesis